MKTKVLTAIQKNHMFGQGAVLLAAVSGGADSVALLHLLCDIRKSWFLRLEALHLNHNLRGEESDGDEAFVRELCREWEVPLTVESAPVARRAAREGKSLEVAGRECRYEFFSRMSREKSALVATAHTRSDSAETVLLNMVRGTSIRGLSGIPPVRGVFVRPLIDCTRREVEAYCARHGLRFVTDSTNASQEYTRNRIRKNVLPLLEAENPRFLERQADMARLLRADADYLDGMALSAMDSVCLPDGSVDRKGFLALPEVLWGRLLSNLLHTHGVECSSLRIEELLRMIQRGAGKRQLSGEMLFLCHMDYFCLERILEQQPFFSVEVPVELAETGFSVEVFRGKQVHIAVYDRKKIKKTQYFQKKGLNYCLDCDRINRIVTVRQKLPADKLRPVGRGCTKTLKNLFQEAGVPTGLRLRRVVVADAGRVLWVEGVGADESAAADETSRRIMTIEITEGAHAGGYLKNLD